MRLAMGARIRCRARLVRGKPMYQVIAEGIAWVDPDGHDTFTQHEADTIAEVLHRQGYDPVEVVPA